VIGLAATLLLKSQRMLPGRSTIVAGCGSLLVAVAAGILKGGGRVVAVIDVAGPKDWLMRLRRCSRDRISSPAARSSSALRAVSVPLLSRHALSAMSSGATLRLRSAVGADSADAGTRRTLI
jgi:hypothetical protein